MAISGSKAREQEGQSSWRLIRELAARPWPAMLGELELFGEALTTVRPLKKSRRDNLPEAVAELSETLTSRRHALQRPYWSSAAASSAYLHYFLPWNIIRLARILKNLPLPEPRAVAGAYPALYDAGSGPLTLPLALWLAKPAWRRLPLQIFALDKAAHPLELGREIFQVFARLTHATPWRVSLATGSMFALAASRRKASSPLYTWLVAAANVLNEQHCHRKGRQLADETDGEDAGKELTDDFYASLLAAWQPLWQPPEEASLPLPRLFFAEPGTRLGGSAIMRLRRAALNMGLTPHAPCPHAKACPLLAKNAAHKQSSYQAAWCHFVFAAQGAPSWLTRLSQEAGLHKTSLSVSPLLLAPGPRRPDTVRAPDARVISQSFKASPLAGKCRYACSARGLLLLEDAASLPSGSLTRAAVSARRDAKSGAAVAAPGD